MLSLVWCLLQHSVDTSSRKDFAFWLKKCWRQKQQHTQKISPRMGSVMSTNFSDELTTMSGWDGKNWRKSSTRKVKRTKGRVVAFQRVRKILNSLQTFCTGKSLKLQRLNQKKSTIKELVFILGFVVIWFVQFVIE